ncbi:polysaccharide deacetylase [Actinocorallia herbida]|uniref:Polysaccharide deacetylase n=1 Tax=Actinocorallia herbida TaxID=58109 RepID=A0A3N1D151_9ACTN|nr:polysaccharide deacetylase [Actinocorallia herbida]ROO87263.1 polysaccharide deacetylase [Actinocorallia herbida]
MSESDRTLVESGLTVCLSFDFDALSGWVAGSTNPADVSRGEFAAVAVPRVLDLLDRHGIEATFFVPGHTALAYPAQVLDIQRRGHEIGHHGWAHEAAAEFSDEEQREIFRKGAEALEKVTGERPVGYRAPRGSYNATSIDILLENGFLYNSHFSASDFRPYYLRQGDQWSEAGEYVFGRTVDLVEMPFAWHMDDFVHFEFYAGFATTLNAPSAVREAWQGEFDYAYLHEPGGVVVICMHPEVIGRGSRISMLDALIGHMKRRPGVRFARMRDHAAAWREATPVEAWLASDSPLVPRPFQNRP